MRTFLSLLAAGALALTAGLAGAATPRAAEDPAGEVTMSNAPLPRPPVAKPAQAGKTPARATTAVKTGKAGKPAAKAERKKPAKAAGPTRLAKKKR